MAPCRMMSALLLLSLTVFSHAKMYIYPAGKVRWGNGRLLVPGSRVCPNWYKGGFTIGCRGYLKAPVTFYANSQKMRTVWKYPFMIAPANKYWRNPFLKYRKPSSVNFTCKSAWGGKSYSVRVHLTCQTAAPKRQPWKSKPAPWKPKPVVPAPTGRRKVKWVGNRDCVSIDATHPLKWNLPKGWTRERNYGGVTYRKWSKFGGVFRAGTAPLTYEFWVPKYSQYAIVLDMTTKHWTEHNDVFLKFSHGSGVNLWRFGRKRYGGRGYLKAYHNKNGRAKQSFHVDFKAHSFATVEKLRPGRKYYITIGARSTQLTVHRILLFPCSGTRCSFHWPGYQWSLKTCGKY